MIKWIKVKDQLPEVKAVKEYSKAIFPNAIASTYFKSDPILILLLSNTVVYARYECGIYEDGSKWGSWFDLWCQDSLPKNDIICWAKCNLPK